jgi:endoglucanase
MKRTLLLAAGAFALLANGSAPVRMNQVGLLPGGAKRAVAPNPSAQPLPWRLLDATGRVRASGSTTVFGQDPWSGEHVHRVDFGSFRRAGTNYKLDVGGAESRPFSISRDTYTRLPFDALAYFYHNRAGTPIETRFVREPFARPAGHLPEKATCVSGKDPTGNEWKGCSYTLDVTGGWYDAGDHGKYIVNGGITLWTLLNAHERHGRTLFRDGSASIPEAGNRVSDLLDEARWELEFFLKMQVPDGTRASVPVGIKRAAPGMAFSEIDASGMAHHKVADVRWTSLPIAPHEDKERPSTSPPRRRSARASGEGSIRPSPRAASPPPRRLGRRRGGTRKSTRSPTSPAAAAMATRI